MTDTASRYCKNGAHCTGDTRAFWFCKTFARCHGALHRSDTQSVRFRRHFWSPFFTVLLLLSFSLVTPAQSQPTAQGLALSEVPLVLLGDELLPYASRFPVEFASFIGGGFGAEIGSKLDEPFAFDTAWNAVLQEPPSLTKGSESFPLRRGPFFSQKSIERDADQRSAGDKILWNIHSHFWGEKFVGTRVDLRWGNSWKGVRRIQGGLERAYLPQLEPKSTSDQFFRERVLIHQPSSLSSLGWLSFRFQSPAEDVLWIRSPALHAVRQLTGTNREDPLLDSSVALNDLFVWSQSPRQVEVTGLTETEIVVPFYNRKPSSLTQFGPCLVTVPDGGALWNGASQRFPDARPWVPTAARFVPRKVWKIEIRNVDPFSLLSRQALYVDKETFLPVYKIHFGTKGEILRFFGAVWSRAGTEDRRHIAPYLRGMFEVHRAPGAVTDSFSTVEHDELRVCSEYPPGIGRQIFDPSHFFEVPVGG